MSEHIKTVKMEIEIEVVADDPSEDVGTWVAEAAAEAEKGELGFGPFAFRVTKMVVRD